MSTTLPADLLARTPEEAVRRIAHELLAEAAAARDRLPEARDAEALHDFRVAVRRLRSTERAYRDALEGSFGRRARRLLRKVARATGASRDLEVHLEWLDAQRGSLSSRHRPGATWLRDRWREARAETDADLAHEVGTDFARLQARLAKRLPVYWQKVRIDAPLAERRFATLLASRLRATAAELGERLDAITGPEAVEQAHEARIAGKRVRYLLEPVAGLSESVPPVLKRLKRLQAVLGELHDLDVLDGELAGAVEEAGEELEARARADAEAAPDGAPASPAAGDGSVGDVPSSPPVVGATGAIERRQDDRRGADRRAPDPRDPRPGLLALARRARTRRAELFDTLARDWLGRDAAALVAALDGVAATLEAETTARTAPPPMEIERKYLLRSLPHSLRGMPSVEIAQGWIPGTRLLERLREVRRGDEVRHFRTVKLGRGIARIEVEEETTPELFAVLWPTTHERRIRKRRYAVADGPLTWEVDLFAGRDLVLAEVELPTADAAVTVPGWLAPYVVREVTDDAAYVNANLARPEPEPAAPRAEPRPGSRAAQVRTLIEERPRIAERSTAPDGSAPVAPVAPADGDVAAADGTGDLPG